jgi:hypothetical protein
MGAMMGRARTLAIAAVAITALAVACVASCKQRGTIGVELKPVPVECGSATRVTMFLRPGACCSPVPRSAGCKLCQDPCSDGKCVPLVCDGGTCPIENLEHGLSITPPTAGQYATVFIFSTPNDGGSDDFVAWACQDTVADSDGTASKVLMPDAAECCAPVDGGS